MSSPVITGPIVTVHDLVDRFAAECYRSGLLPAEIVAVDLAELNPEQVAREIEKLILRRVERRLVELRSTSDEEKERKKELRRRWEREGKDVANRAVERTLERLRRVRIRTPDGQLKALINFRLADSDWWAKYTHSNREAWGKREEWFQTAARLLRLRKVSTVANLPSDDLAQLESLAGQTW